MTADMDSESPAALHEMAVLAFVGLGGVSREEAEQQLATGEWWYTVNAGDPEIRARRIAADALNAEMGWHEGAHCTDCLSQKQYHDLWHEGTGCCCYAALSPNAPPIWNAADSRSTHAFSEDE